MYLLTMRRGKIIYPKQANQVIYVFVNILPNKKKMINVNIFPG
jgi:hypothetical protein